MKWVVALVHETVLERCFETPRKVSGTGTCDFVRNRALTQRDERLLRLVYLHFYSHNRKIIHRYGTGVEGALST